MRLAPPGSRRLRCQGHTPQAPRPVVLYRLGRDSAPVGDRDGTERELRWVERGMVVRGRPAGPVLPLFVPFRNLQRRGDGPVVVPASIRGRAHVAKLEIELGANDPLVWLAGPHRG